MTFIIGLLTFVMLLDCLVLVLLVLMQLPKKEAGAGLAFGGAATDALFGAGSGNFLTKATKYAAGTFFALAIILSVLQSQFYRGQASDLLRELKNPPTTPATAPEGAPTLPGPIAPGAQTTPTAPLESVPPAPPTEPAPAPNQ